MVTSTFSLPPRDDQRRVLLCFAMPTSSSAVSKTMFTIAESALVSFPRQAVDTGRWKSRPRPRSPQPMIMAAATGDQGIAPPAAARLCAPRSPFSNETSHAKLRLLIGAQTDRTARSGKHPQLGRPWAGPAILLTRRRRGPRCTVSLPRREVLSSSGTTCVSQENLRVVGQRRWNVSTKWKSRLRN